MWVRETTQTNHSTCKLIQSKEKKDATMWSTSFTVENEKLHRQTKIKHLTRLLHLEHIDNQTLDYSPTQNSPIVLFVYATNHHAKLIVNNFLSSLKFLLYSNLFIVTFAESLISESVCMYQSLLVILPNRNPSCKVLNKHEAMR